MNSQMSTSLKGEGRVLYDERWFGTTGIGRFSREVGARLRGVEALPLAGNPASAFDVIRLSWYMAINRRAFVLSPGFNSPLIGLSRCVLTVHDLNHIDVSHNSGVLKRIYYRLVLKRACRRAAKVLTVSEFSKRRIMQWSGAGSDQVVVVGNGVSEIFLDSKKNDVSRDPSEGYLFCVGNRKQHKNEGAAIRALTSLVRYPKLRLIFSGNHSSELAAMAEECGVSNRVSFAGALSEENLSEMYRCAIALLFPSFYEGFGLPAIEAMAVGCPVIASRATALGEVAGGAALLFDPESDAEIVDRINSVISSSEIRQELQRLGLERVKLFDWKVVAGKVQDEIGPHLNSSFSSR